MAGNTQETIGLELERTIPATPEQVFDAWTRPEQVSRWFSPSSEYTTVVHALDPRLGGSYRIELRHASGKVRIAYGEYRVFDRPRQLAFTWRWESDASMPDTLVSIDLRAAGEGTRLVLQHKRFDSAAMRDEHEKGWTGCLARIEVALAS